MEIDTMTVGIMTQWLVLWVLWTAMALAGAIMAGLALGAAWRVMHKHATSSKQWMQVLWVTVRHSGEVQDATEQMRIAFRGMSPRRRAELLGYDPIENDETDEETV
jgi:hypothetical protein